jgi:hypothetical protein
MENPQSTNGQAGLIAGFPAAQAAFESWAGFNTRMARLYVDASLAQLKGMQDLMSVGLTPVIHSNGAATNGGGAAGAGQAEMLQSEVALVRRQMEDAVALSRRMADEARRAAFEIADLVLHLPFAGAKLAAIDTRADKAD